MKLPWISDRRLRELTDESFGPFRKPDHAKAACETVLGRLKQLPASDKEDAATASGTRARDSRFLLVAAVLMVMAVIGLFAARRIQQASSSPSAVSAVEPRETPRTIAPVTAPAVSPQPVIARHSGREPLRTPAEEIASAQNTDSGAQRLQFAAASIRRESSDTRTPGVFNCRGVDGQLFSLGNLLEATTPPTPQGRCIAEKSRLDVIIGRAFTSLPLRPYSGGPDRTVVGVPDTMLLPPHFVIRATAEDTSRVTKAELQQMLQTLLLDRFKLRFRREIRQEDGYVLTVSKSGIKFAETSGPEQDPGFGPVLPAAERDRIRQLGGLLPVIMKGNFRISEIVKDLECCFLVKPVDDKTGLKGLYAITLNVQRVENGAAATAGLRGGNTGGPVAPEYAPPLSRAFEEQLGLHLEPAKVPVEYLIIEHIEMPSEN